MSALRSSRLAASDLVKAALGGLGSRATRTTLSALGIAIGIAAMVGVLGISESSKADLLSQLDRLGTNLLTVSPGKTLGGNTATLPKDAPRMIRRIDGVSTVSAVAQVDNVTVRRSDRIPPEETGGISVHAADSEFLKASAAQMYRGQWIDDGRFPTVVLGRLAAQRLGITTAGQDVQVYVGGRWLTVVGITESFPLLPGFDRAAFVSFHTAQALFGEGESPTAVYVRTAADRVTQVRSNLAATANPENPAEVVVSRPSDALAARAAAKSAFTALFLGLGAVALLVGGVGVANVMVISVLERRSEIGLRRALGATKGHVRAQFLTEALLLAGLGGVAGVLLGTVVTAAFAMSRGWEVVVPANVVPGGVAVSLAIGAAAGVYPAARAARLAPVEALRTT